MGKARRVPTFRVGGFLATLIGVGAAFAAWFAPELVPAVSFGLFAAAAVGAGQRGRPACDGVRDHGLADGESIHATQDAPSPVADPEDNGHRSALRCTVIMINR
jgi:hypothetical protein